MITWKRHLPKANASLAEVCLSALEPDLVILDEFQRFKSLFDGDDDASLLAKPIYVWRIRLDRFEEILAIYRKRQ